MTRGWQLRGFCTETSVIFAALIGMIFLKERFGARRVAAAAVIATAIVNDQHLTRAGRRQRPTVAGGSRWRSGAADGGRRGIWATARGGPTAPGCHLPAAYLSSELRLPTWTTSPAFPSSGRPKFCSTVCSRE
jgi:hypothetical protein